MLVGSQQRITINNKHYYEDMVFYNKPLKSYVIIELKTTKLMAEEYKRFEDIKIVREDDTEFWSARELAVALDYIK